MRLYKYRSLENLKLTLDILQNQRLYCASFESLNDPFEGLFVWVMTTGGALGLTALNTARIGRGVTVRSPKSIAEFDFLFGNSRVCSLSKTSSDVRLWSHYAGGHTGVAIEIEIDETDELVHEVEYLDKLRESGVSLLTGPRREDVLRVKTRHWDYEKEYRIISDSQYYEIDGRIKAIYFGLRADPLLRKAILDSLPKGISAFSTKLDESRLEIVPDQNLKAGETQGDV